MPTNDKFFTRPSFSRQLKQYSGTTGEFSGSSTFKEFVDIGTPLANLPTGVDYSKTGITSTISSQDSNFTANTSTNTNTFVFSSNDIQAESYRLSALTTSNSGTTQTISLLFSGTTTYTSDGNTFYGDYTGVTYTFNVLSMTGISANVYTGECRASTVSIYTADTFSWITKQNGSTRFLSVSGGTQTERLYVDNDAIVGGDLNVTGNTTIKGDLTILGTATTMNTETIQAEDNNIDLNYGGNNVSAQYGGIRLLYGVGASTHSSITANTSGIWVLDPGFSSHTATITGQLKYSNGTPGVGKMLISDAVGNASWGASNDVFVTGGTYSAGNITQTNITGGTYNIDVTALTADTHVFVTGGTYSSGDITFTNLSGGTFDVDVNALLDDTNNYVTGATMNGDVLELERHNLSDVTVNLSQFNTPSYWSATTSGHIVNSGTTGNVGIGNTNPNHELSVTGSISGTSDLYVDGTINPGINALKDVIATGTSIVIANNGIGSTPTAGSGADNLVIGHGSLNNGGTGTNNIVLGRNSGLNKGGGSFNIMIGKQVLGSSATSSPSGNTMIGHRTGFNFWTGHDNIVLGHNAGSSGTFSRSVVLGVNAGNLQYGNNQTILGYNAGADPDNWYNTSTISPTYIGAYAGYNVHGHSNIAIGSEAGYNKSVVTHYTGTSNIMIGNGVLLNTSGSTEQFVLGSLNKYLASGVFSAASQSKLGINISNDIPTANLQVKGHASDATTFLVEDASDTQLFKVGNTGTLYSGTTDLLDIFCTAPCGGGSDDNTYVTGGTYSAPNLTYTNNTGGTFNINVNALLDDTNNYLTGSTMNGDVLELERHNMSDITVDLSQFNTPSYWSATTSGNIVTSGTTGNVGIGTDSPIQKLDVDGIGLFRNDLWISGATTAYYPTLKFDNGGTPNPLGQIQCISTGGGTAGEFVFKIVNTERMRLDQSGNLGIGTNNPNEKLTVVGSISATSYVFTNNFRMENSPTDGYVLTSDASGNATWEAASGGGGTDGFTGITSGGTAINTVVRHGINFIEGSGINISYADDGGNDRVDVTIEATQLDSYNNVGNTGSTLTWDVSGTSTQYEVTLTSNGVLNLIGVRNGDYGTMIVNQDSTGSRTLALGTINGSSGTHLVVNGGGGALVLTTNPASIDMISFTYNGTKMFWTVGNDYS